MNIPLLIRFNDMVHTQDFKLKLNQISLWEEFTEPKKAQVESEDEYWPNVLQRCTAVMDNFYFFGSGIGAENARRAGSRK
jgi:hypothetical protein